MKNQKGVINLALPIVIAVVLLGIIAFGYFWYLPKVNENKNANTNQVVVNTNVNQNANSNQNTNGTVIVNGNENVNSSANTNTNTVVNSNTNTAGYETYTNNTLKFSIKHPAGWTIDDASTPNKVWFNPVGTEQLDSIEVETRSLTDWLASFDSDIVEQRTITVDGYTGTQVDLTAFFLQETAIPKDGQLYIIRSNRYIKDLNLLSTFQFTDETAGWKTYISTLANFTIDYNPDWMTTGFEGLQSTFGPNSDVLYFHSQPSNGDYICVDIRIGSTVSNFSLTGGEVIATLPNGLKIYQQQKMYQDKSYPMLTLTRSDTSVITAPNGQLLWVMAMFNCVQGDIGNTSLNYQQQLSDERFLQAIEMLKTFAFSS
ncbi:MAG: hypothetical protein WC528_03770 [Patescibacteria group bacterium]